jgi:drug/metabolite transporter (DMT)-like permease
VWNFQVIERAGATTASTVTYLTPLVAIIVGALLLGEPVTLNEPLGGLVVLLGVALAQGRLPLPTRRRSG